jgi:RND superfamily putative drug exporter
VLGRLTGSVLRRRWFVLALWGLVVVAGSLSADRLPRLLSTSLAVPGTSSERADTILAQGFGQNAEGTFTVVLRRGHTTAAELHELDRDLAHAERAVPAASSTPFQVGGGVLYADVGSALDIGQAAGYTAPLRRSLRRSGLAGALVTGAPALQHDLAPVLARDLRRGEVVAVVFALVVLALFTGISPALAVPFVVALCATAASLGIVFLLAHVVVTALYVPNLVELVGLGLAIDYSLLVVQRFREELAGGPGDVADAIGRTMRSAGRTVVVSGSAVAVGLSALLLVPVPFVRSLGLAGLVVPLVSVATALTLQPVLLSLIGRHAVGARQARTGSGVPTGVWTAIGGLVVRRRGAVLAGSVGLLLVASAPIAWLRLTPGSLTALPASLPSTQALDLVRADVGPGVVTPIEVVVDAGRDGLAGSAPIAAATLRLAHELLRDPEVYVVAIGTRAPYVDRSGHDARVVVVGRHDFGDEQSQLLVRELRDRFVPDARFPAHVVVDVGGAPAQGVDFIARVYGTFPLAAGLALVVAYLVLVVAVRSALLALVAVALDVVSVAAAYGVLVVVFRDGLGADTLHLYRVAQISAWVPVVLFALLFGLSMDYEVFLVSRMRELWDGGAGPRDAIAGGLGRTGGIVSVAALVMVGALSGLVGGQVVDLQELGVGLAVGVVLDATVVRGLLLPSIMAYLGPASWWLPARLRALGARDGPAAAASGRRGRADRARAGEALRSR